MKIVFIQSHNGGKLANQLWNYISIYAFCLEKRYLLVNPTFAQYEKYFYYLKNNALNSPNFRLRKFFNKNWGHILLHLVDKLNYKLRIATTLRTGLEDNAIILPPSDDSLRTRAPIMLLNGWLFRNPQGLEKHGDKIREKFKLTKEYQITVDNFIAQIPKDKFKIAIHIRRTDYKTHLDGKYYYSIADYIKVMKKLKHEYANKNVIFILTFDEKVERSEFNEFSNEEIILSGNHFIVD